MLAQGVPARLARLGSALASRLTQPAPCISGVRYLGLYDDKERGDERVHFAREDEKLLRNLLAKVKAQADQVDQEGAEKTLDAEMEQLKVVLPGHKLSAEEVKKLLVWKHEV